MPSTTLKNPSFKGLKPASEVASRSKRANSAQNTKPEILLRRAMWRLGLRYRINVSTLPGKPDVVLSGARLVIFCDGDFWHGRYWESRREKLRQGWNADYWIAKIQKNMQRDLRNTALLEASGWYVLRLWESDITKDPRSNAKQVQRILEQRKSVSRYKTDAAMRGVQ